jgi:heme a synthase
MTFPLIWMGGFVTTYRAGMAVPDWPTTYGYNMFLYPLESWLKVWDVFLEHSHRLIAAAVGMVTIALAVALWLGDRRKWMRWLGVAAVAGVSFQGVLGGLRVIADERFLAKVHGCTAPLFFALTAALVALTAEAWRDPTRLVERTDSPWLRRLTLAVTIAVYFQIVAGAQLRHLTALERVYWFAFWVWTHLVLAGTVAAGVVAIGIVSRRHLQGQRMLLRRANSLLAVLLLQLTLGVITWVTNYGWPAWFTDYVWTVRYTVVAGGAAQAVNTTAHVAVGSLVLVIALSLTLWSWRLLDPACQPVQSSRDNAFHEPASS